ncbi:TonB-dependent receptor domain-containing protein [Sphingomonas profundi]|uniref:TonB-dependent receptor domain-containing protein n=1 Tax=Alterirhizorhabdus profundi TaxID=2681549 RepID=UPI0012E7ED03|nr:TonB-dependent receptor [Sphingomonas profundi]
MLTPYRSRLLASTLFVGATVLAQPAFAQTADPATPPPGATPQEAAPAAESSSGDIIVTGTLIRNPNLVSSSPVSVTSSEEIALKQSTVADRLIRDIPGVAAGIGSNTNNGNGGASFADLRGLGANRNIVLLDGTRITPANLNGNVDLNNIPLALVDRVDLLTGGASTTYGADAVSGVVNFITKRDFAGIDLTVSNGITERGDGNRFRADVTIGGNFDDGKGNAVLSIGYQQADEVFFAGQRPRSNDTLDSFDGTAAGASQTAVPARFSVAGVGNRNIDPTTGNLVPVFAFFNFNPYNIFQTPFERFNIYGAAHYEVSDSLEVYTQGLFSKNTVNTIIAPSGAFSSPVSIPVSNPYLPAGARATFCANNDFNPTMAGVQTLTPAQCALAATATSPTDPNYKEFSTNLSRRAVEAGGRVSQYKTTIFNYRAGLRGQITDSIRYDVYGAYGESENTQTQQNYVLIPRLQQALRSTNTTACLDPTGGCVPVNVFGAAGTITQDAVNFLQAPAFSSNNTSLAQVHGVLNSDLFTIGSASQPVAVAVGGEFRKYKADIQADTLAQSPGALGGAGGGIIPVNGGYRVYEGFGELIMPLVSDAPFAKSLTLEAGIRYSSYKVDAAGSPSFNATTYKGGATWEPIDGLKVRGNYQHAVRAPNIGELFQPSQVGLTNLRTDPCQGQAPVNNALLRAVCIAQGAPASQIGAIDPPSAGQINATFAGNPNNKPEKADTYTAGVVFQPDFVSGFSISVDYYRIRIKNALTAPTPGDTIAACFGNLTAASATSPLCTVIRRDPATGGLDGDASTTPGLPSPTTNSGRLATDGIDVVANYRTNLNDTFKLAVSASANYVFSYKFRAAAGGLNRECAGYYSVNCLPGNALIGGGGSILPEFSLNQRTTLSVKNFDLSLLWRHISSVKQEPFDADASNFGSNGPAFAAFRKIKAYDIFDLSGRVGVTDNVELTVVVENLLDKQPPSVGSNIGSTTFNSGNTYPSTYDALGRRFTVGAHLKF